MAAWRPNENLIEGELDNTTPGRVTGWISFVGLQDKMTLDLEGDFHRDIRGTKIHIRNDQPAERSPDYMDGMALHQTGKVGDITAGLPPQDYVNYPYVEWYSEQNGRVVFEPDQMELLGTPLPFENEKPVSRADQERNLQEFMRSLAEALNQSRSEQEVSPEAEPELEPEL